MGPDDRVRLCVEPGQEVARDCLSCPHRLLPRAPAVEDGDVPPQWNVAGAEGIPEGC